MGIADAHELAGLLRKALTDDTVGTTIGALLADPVELHHHPAAPSDGPMPREVLAAMMGNPPTGNLTDAKRTTESVEIDGNGVAVTTVLTGALASGERIRVPNRSVYTVADGLITRIDSYYEPKAMADMQRALGGS